MRKRNLVLATVIVLVASIAYLAPASSAVAGPDKVQNHLVQTSLGSVEQTKDISGYFSYKTGKTYQGRDVWVSSYYACISEAHIWQECMNFRWYVNGLSVWGVTHTLVGLHGAHACHTDGSYGYGLTWQRTNSCGEHNLSSDRMKQWYSFDECVVGGYQCNTRSFHIYFYAKGGITGPYMGVGL